MCEIFFEFNGQPVAPARLSPSILAAMALADARSVRAELRSLRTEKRLTPEEFADEARVSRATVYRIEDLERPYAPRIDTIEALVRAQGLTLSTFFERIEARDQPVETAIQLRPEITAELGADAALSHEQVEFLEQLAWACLRGADVAGRTNAQGILEELAVSFRRAANSATDGRDEIRVARERRRGRQAAS